MKDKIEAAVRDKIAHSKFPDGIVPEEIVIKIEYRETTVTVRIASEEIINAKGDLKNERI